MFSQIFQMRDKLFLVPTVLFQPPYLVSGRARNTSATAGIRLPTQDNTQVRENK